jgi:deazaflavin-dependent oxidoreductase (nitroreductase family)
MNERSERIDEHVALERASWLTGHAATDNCYVTTVGRRSGRRHEVEIWFGVRDDTLYLISGNGAGADWYRNALAAPTVTVRIDGEVRDGRARAVGDGDERRAVGELMGAKYPSYEDESIGLSRQAWCLEVPALAIDSWGAPVS